MHQKSIRNVLAVGVTADEFGRVVPFLDRGTFDVDRFPSATGALELISNIPFEMLLVRFPLPDMDTEHFLRLVRREGSACMRSPLLILTHSNRLVEAGRLLALGANRTIDIESSPAEIQASISSVLNVAPRKAARFLARLEIKISGEKDMVLCQTENFSTTGMLIRTDRRWETGTQIEFEFSIPNDPRPVRGVAQVVRHTVSGRDSVGGIGLRFLSFAGDAHRRFQAFIQQL